MLAFNALEYEMIVKFNAYTMLNADGTCVSPRVLGGRWGIIPVYLAPLMGY